MVSIVGYIGAFLMVAFSFVSLLPLALCGLILLTFQAFYLRAWNLVGLNCLSFIGFSIQFLGGVL